MKEATTPVKMSSKIEVSCAPEAAFAYVSDITTHPAWSPDNIRILAAPKSAPAVGARYRTVGFSVVRGSDSEADLEVTVFEPPTRFAFVATSGPQTFENEFTFTPSAGGTQIERTVRFQAPPAAVERMNAIGPEVTRRRDTALQMLKERLERPVR